GDQDSPAPSRNCSWHVTAPCTSSQQVCPTMQAVSHRPVTLTHTPLALRLKQPAWTRGPLTRSTSTRSCARRSLKSLACPLLACGGTRKLRSHVAANRTRTSTCHSS